MIAQSLLSKHVSKTALLAMLGATAVLSGLQVLFTYLSELGDLNDQYGAWQALLYVLWGAPSYLNQILPISALIGAAIGLGSLASNSELVVMRAVGVSLWRIVWWVIRSAMVLVLLSFVLTEWIIPYSNEQAKTVKTQQQSAELGQVQGYWSREGQRFVYIDYANAKGQLRGVQVLDFDDNFRLEQWNSAVSGHYREPGLWQLQQAQQVTLQANGDALRQALPQQNLNLALQPQYVHMVTIDPEDLSPSQLVQFMQYLKQYSQVPKTYQLAFWQKVGAPFSLMALVLIACSFIFGPLRQHSMGFRLVIALFVGLGFFYLKDFLGYASLVYSPSPAWFVFVPIVMMFAIGGYLLYRAR